MRAPARHRLMAHSGSLTVWSCDNAVWGKGAYALYTLKCLKLVFILYVTDRSTIMAMPEDISSWSLAVWSCYNSLWSANPGGRVHRHCPG